MGGLKEGSVFGDTWRIVPLVSLDLIDRFTASHIEVANNNNPPARVGHAAVLCGNAFIVYAGDTVDTDIDGCPDDNFYMFNINNCKYTTPLHVLNKPKGRYGHSLGVVSSSAKSSKLFMFGGQLESEVFDDLHYFELTSFKLPKARWELVVPENGLKPPPLTNHSMSIYKTKIYVFGGVYNNEKVSNDLWCYDTITNRWLQLSTTGLAPLPVNEHSAVIANDRLYLYGGNDFAGIIYDTLYCLDLHSLHWTRLAKDVSAGHPGPRCGHTMTFLPNLNKIVIMGGDKNDYVSSDPHDFDTHEDYGVEELGTMIFELDLAVADHFLRGGAVSKKVAASAAVAGGIGAAGRRTASPAPSEDTFQGHHRRSFSAGPEDFRTPNGSVDNMQKSLDPKRSEDYYNPDESYDDGYHTHDDDNVDNDDNDDNDDNVNAYGTRSSVPQRQSTLSEAGMHDNFVEVPSSTVSQHETTSDLDDMRDKYFIGERAQSPAFSNGGRYLTDEDDAGTSRANNNDTPILSRDFARSPGPVSPNGANGHNPVSRQSSVMSDLRSPVNGLRAATEKTPNASPKKSIPEENEAPLRPAPDVSRAPAAPADPQNDARVKRIISELNAQLDELKTSSKRDMDAANTRIRELEESQQTLTGGHERVLQEKDALIDELRHVVNPEQLQIDDDQDIADVQAASGTSRGFTELTKYKLDRLDLRNKLVYLETENAQLKDKFERFEPFMNNQIGELTTLQKVIKGQEDKIALLSSQVALEEVLHRQISEWKHKYEDLKVEHDNFKAIHADVEVTDDENDNVNDRSLEAGGAGTRTKSSKQISAYLERLVKSWETTKLHDEGTRLANTQDNTVVSQLQQQVDELLRTSKTQHQGSSAEVQALEAEVAAKLQSLRQYEGNYRDALQSVNNTHKALQLTNEELRNQKLLIEKLVKENNELKLFKKANNRSSTRGNIGGGVFDQGAMSSGNGSPNPGVVTPPQEEDEDEFGFTSAHYNMKLKDMEADLYILKQERDQLNETVASLKKELYLAQNT